MRCLQQGSTLAQGAMHTSRARPTRTHRAARPLVPPRPPLHISHRNTHRTPHASSTPPSASAQVDASNPHWTGVDQFTPLDDRKDLPPLPLPPIASRKRVVLVRHGQSSWNKAGIIQGSSDASVLTPKGQQQAATTRNMLEGVAFDALFHSPLERARHTAEIVWNGRPGPVNVLPSLREVDLYDFQGLVKAEGKQRFGAEYSRWQQYPHLFEVSGHAPVRELWYRASLAWQDILSTPESTKVLLVVAHNALNQALISTALGLPPANFRRFIQSNGATTVLDFLPSKDAKAGPQVALLHLNEEPATSVYKPPGKVQGGGQLLLLCCETADSARGSTTGRHEPWAKQAVAFKAAEVLMEHEIRDITTNGSFEAGAVAEIVAGLWAEVAAAPAPGLVQLKPHQPGGVRGWWQELMSSWTEGDVRLLVATEEQLRQVTASALQLTRAAAGALRFEEGGLTTIELPSLKPGTQGADTPAAASEVPTCQKAKLLHLNTTSHLGVWAAPINEPLGF